MFEIDLHTHSEASPDGGITLRQYDDILTAGHLKTIAITDHNRIDFALQAQAHLGESIIVGEEIMTSAGEIIGLYLQEAVRPGLSPLDTVAAIKQQGGLVYIPHPFETVRKGLHPADLEAITQDIDIIELCNGRAFLQNRSQQAVVWARVNNIVGAASSDAHGVRGLGKSYTIVKQRPTRKNLVHLLQHSQMITDRPSVRALLYPKYHRAKKRLKRERHA